MEYLGARHAQLPASITTVSHHHCPGMGAAVLPIYVLVTEEQVLAELYSCHVGIGTRFLLGSRAP